MTDETSRHEPHWLDAIASTAWENVWDNDPFSSGGAEASLYTEVCDITAFFTDRAGAPTRHVAALRRGVLSIEQDGSWLHVDAGAEYGLAHLTINGVGATAKQDAFVSVGLDAAGHARLSTDSLLLHAASERLAWLLVVTQAAGDGVPGGTATGGPNHDAASQESRPDLATARVGDPLDVPRPARVTTFRKQRRSLISPVGMLLAASTAIAFLGWGLWTASAGRREPGSIVVGATVSPTKRATGQEAPGSPNRGLLAQRDSSAVDDTAASDSIVQALLPRLEPEALVATINREAKRDRSFACALERELAKEALMPPESRRIELALPAVGANARERSLSRAQRARALLLKVGRACRSRATVDTSSEK
jgi:hypothetical protein